MFFILKKRNIAVVVAIIFFVSIILLANNSDSASSYYPSYEVIVIDAGHGGIDGGVEGVATGVKESDINLAISLMLKDYLESGGYRVVMTRDTEDGLYGSATSNRKAIDFAERKRIIEEAEPSLVVSIHQNSFPSPTVCGAQVFYAKGSEISKTYAQTFQNTLNASLDYDRNIAIGDYYILECTAYPSVLVECGFLSNYEEEKLLSTSEYQDKIAYILYSSINSIFRMA